MQWKSNNRFQIPNALLDITLLRLMPKYIKYTNRNGFCQYS